MTQYDTNATKYSAAEQYELLVGAGFADYMKYDSSGNEIDTSSDDWESTAVQAFWDAVDSQKDEMQSLHDSIKDYEEAVIEAQNNAYEILKEIEDNQIAVEDKVLAALEDSRQRAIDELQDQRDAIEEAAQDVINGLSEQLQKERDMYTTQESQDELSSLQRQLAVLQRSGGSDSQIASLQKEIASKQQDAYFDMQQKQIDALQEASDNEIERLDAQIELMTETLEYEKANGLLWLEVEEIMLGSPEQIASYIYENDSALWAESPTKNAQTYRETLFEADQFTTYRDEMKGGISSYTAKFTDDSIKTQAKLEEISSKIDAVANSSSGSGSSGSSGSGSGGSDDTSGSTTSNTTGGTTSNTTGSTTTTGSLKAITEAAVNGIKTAVNTVSGGVINAVKKTSLTKTNTISMVTVKNNATGNAFAKGTLLGELGPEAWVGNGRFHIAGTTGAEFVDLPDDAIVFNHQQTANLLRTGKAYGRGNAITSVDNAIGNDQRNSFISSFWNSVNTRSSNSLANALAAGTISSLSSNVLDSINQTNNDGITIEQAIVEMHVAKIDNDYDAQRAGEQALEKMVQIARKTSGQRVGR